LERTKPNLFHRPHVEISQTNRETELKRKPGWQLENKNENSFNKASQQLVGTQHYKRVSPIKRTNLLNFTTFARKQ
jgi:hypothetical protein